jgi:hypothetical protein
MKPGLAALAILLAGCVVGDEDDTLLIEGKRGTGNLFERVVLGRLYQDGRWMVPAADMYKATEIADVNARRVAYACDTIAPLKPTYVSGLVRLAWNSTITPEIKFVFNGVKACIRQRVGHTVRFDVALNAKHYTEPSSKAEKPEDGVKSVEEGIARLKERLRTGNAELDPEVWFFDFYSQPFNDKSTPWHTGALRDGINRIRASGRFVGGNIWGQQAPDGSDFITVPLNGGLDANLDKLDHLQSRLPTLMHIRNDPHICDSEGLDWFKYTPDRRADMFANHASKQSDLNVGYMYPVFFPLSGTPKCAPDVPQHAYDVKADNQLNRMQAVMDRFQYRPR